MAYNPNFQWKLKAVTITANTALPAGYQVKLTIPKEAEMQSDFRDLRFETTDGYGLSHWLETIVSTTATVWVKLKAIVSTSGTVVINMYYGNPYVASASNGTNTFDFFDDFTGPSLEPSKWAIGTATLSSSIATFTGGHANSTFQFPVNRSVVYYASFSSAAYGSVGTQTIDHSTAISLYYANYPVANVMNAFHDATNYINMGNFSGYHRYETARNNGTNDKFNIDNGTIQTITAGTNNGTHDVYINPQSEPVLVDWVFVRKYVATEPTVPTTTAILALTATTVNWNLQRKKIIINTTTATPVNYQIKITVPFAAEMNNDFSNLRFVTKMGTALDYWLESSSAPGVTAYVWVELADAIGASSSDYIYMHYGNPNMASVSNGYNTFDFFDDFTGTTINLAKWTIIQTGSIISQNGELIHGVGNVGWGNTGIYSSSSFNRPFIYQVQSRHNTSYTMHGVKDATSGVSYVDYVGGMYINITTASIVEDGSWSSNPIPGFSFTQNSNVLYKFIVLTTGMIYYASTDLGITWTLLYTSSYSSESPLKIGVSQESNSDIGYYDNAFIRKYVATEPTIDQTAAAETINTFARRKKLTINNNSGSTLTDYQIQITVTYTTAMQTNFNDIRFVDSSGNLLPYWIESSTPSSIANVWIKVNLPNYGASPTGDNIVYMYYGNANLTSASDGTNTFEFFDDFEGAGKIAWTNYVGTWINDGGYRKQTSTSGNYKTSYVTTTLTDYIVHVRVKAIGALGSYGAEGVVIEKEVPTDYNFIIGTIDYTNRARSAILQMGTGWFGQTAMGFTVVADTWYDVNMLRRANVQKLSIQPIGTALSWQAQTTRPSLALTLVGMGGGYDSATWFDDFYVRKYTSTEPTVTTGAEEHIRKGSIIIY